MKKGPQIKRHSAGDASDLNGYLAYLVQETDLRTAKAAQIKHLTQRLVAGSRPETWEKTGADILPAALDYEEDWPLDMLVTWARLGPSGWKASPLATASPSCGMKRRRLKSTEGS